MHIEKQVCTRDQAKKLSQLGIKADTMLYWVDFTGFDQCGHMLCRPASRTELESKEGFSWIIVGDTPDNLLPACEDEACGASGGIYPALTVAELGSILNSTHGVFVNSYYNAHVGCWCCEYRAYEEVDSDIVLKHTIEELDSDMDTEAGVRAEMVICLLEDILLIPEICNESIS